MDWVKLILNLDRRIIFTIVALLVIVPLLFPFELPVNVTPEVQSYFDAIDALPEGSNIVVAGDFDPASKAELLPMFEVVLAHCFTRNLKTHIVTLWPAAPSLLQTVVDKQAKAYNKTSGTDYCYLGYKPGAFAVIVGMNNSIPGTFPTDNYGRPTAQMPIYASKTAMKDFDFIAELAAGQSVETWITFGSEPNKIPMAISVTAVSAAQYYTYLQAGQVVGLGGGMKGAAEYEVLFRQKYDQQGSLPAGDATKGMDAQSAVHMFIVLSIILANIAFAVQGKREQAAMRGAA
jgi:hypothetical protein